MKCSACARPHGAKTYRKPDADQVEDALRPLIGQHGILGTELVGSVAKYGESEKDVDILLLLDPAFLGYVDYARKEDPKGRFGDPEQYDAETWISFLDSDEPKVKALVKDVFSTLEKAGYEYLDSDDETTKFRGPHPRHSNIELWWTFSRKEDVQDAGKIPSGG